jgi:hypothetical protein
VSGGESPYKASPSGFPSILLGLALVSEGGVWRPFRAPAPAPTKGGRGVAFTAALHPRQEAHPVDVRHLQCELLRG